MNSPSFSAPAARPEPAPATRYQHHEIDGLRLFVRTAGDRERPAIVLLHGFPSSSHMFRDLIPLLAPRFFVVAPDFPGFGHSDSPPLDRFPYTFDAIAGIVERLLEVLGVARYVHYLHDYGGPVGWRLARRHPERVLGQVIQNANAYLAGVSLAVSEVFMPLWQSNDERGARRMLLPETTRYQYLAGARDLQALNPDPWTLDQALLDRPGNDLKQLALFRDYANNVAQYDAWHQYFRAHRPKTLIVWGRGDPFFTVDGAKAFRDDLPDAQLHFLDGGHFALEEYAREIAQLITQTFA